MARRNVGSVEADLLANTTKFQSQVKAAADEASRNEIELSVGVDEEDLKSVEEIIDEAVRNMDPEALVGLALAQGDIDAALEELGAKVDLQEYEANLGIELANTDIDAALAELGVRLDLEDLSVSVGTDIDLFELDMQLAEVGVAVSSFPLPAAQIGTDVDLSELDMQLLSLGVDILAFPLPSAQIGTDVDFAELDLQLIALGIEVATFPMPSVQIDTDIDPTQVAAQMIALGAATSAGGSGAGTSWATSFLSGLGSVFGIGGGGGGIPAVGGGGGGGGGGIGKLGAWGQAIQIALIGAIISPASTALLGLAGGAVAIASSAFFGLSAAIASIGPAIFSLGGIGATFALALGGLPEAFSTLSGQDWDLNSDEVQEALENLTPAAADFVSAIAEIKPAFDGLQDILQEKVFDGLGDSLRGLADEVIPGLLEAFSGIADELNGFFLDIIDTLGEHDLGQMFTDLMPTVSALLGLMDSLLGIFLGLVEAATPLANELFGGLADAFAGLDENIKNATDDGSLGNFFAAGLDSLRAFWDLIAPLGSALFEIFKVGKEFGDEFLTSLGDIVGNFSDWLKTTEGSNALVTFFTKTRTVLKGLGPLFEGLGKAAAIFFSDEAIEIYLRVAKAIGDALPGIASFFILLGEVGAVVFEAFSLVMQILAPVFRVVAEFVAAFGHLFNPITQIGWLFSNVLGPALSWIGERFAFVVGAVGGAIDWFKDLFTVIGTMFGGDLEGEAGEGGGFGWLIDALNNVIAAAEAVWNFFTVTLIPFFQTAFSGAVSVVKTVVDALATAWEGVRAGAEAAWTWLNENIVPFFQTVLGGAINVAHWALGALEAAFTFLKNTASTVWNWFAVTAIPFIEGSFVVALQVAQFAIGAFEAAFTFLKNTATTVWNWFRDTVVPFFEDVFSTAVNIAHFALGGLEAAFTFLKNTATIVYTWLKDTLVPWIEDKFGPVWDTAVAAVQAVVDVFVGALDAAKDFVNYISGLSTGSFGGFAAKITSVFLGPLGTLMSTLAAAQIAVDNLFSQDQNTDPLNPPLVGPGGGNVTAAGGLFTGTSYRVIGEAGPEAVIPLTRPLSQIDPSVRGMAAALRGGEDGGMSSLGGSGVTNNWNIFTETEDPAAVAVQVMNEISALVAA